MVGATGATWANVLRRVAVLVGKELLGVRKDPSEAESHVIFCVAKEIEYGADVASGANQLHAKAKIILS